MNWRAGIALAILAFLGGAIAFGWLTSSGLTPWDPPAPVVPIPQPEPTVATPPAPAAPPPLTPPAQPGGDPARAEAMMVAMAARRAIEAGAPLGELSPRLQRSFAASSPAALARILAADRQRLTVTQLLADFDATAPMLRERPVMSWDRLRGEISTLFVIRSADTPPPTVDAQLQVARDYLASGNVKAALRMVAALPGAANAQGWMAEARRFVETQAALDEIDQAALTMPSAAISAAPAPAPAPQATEEPGSSDPPRP